MQFYNITDNLQTRFVLSAIAAAPKVNLTGFTNELVVLTPPNVTLVPMLPKRDGVFFRLDGLRREKLQEGKMTSGTVIEFISVHHGLPDVCAACGAPAQRYGLFMAKTRNSRNTRRLTISGENAQQVFEAIQNNREFIALPLCGQHSAVSLFYKEKEFYTDDARYAQMLADSGFAVTPVQQVAGAHIQPQPPQVIAGVRTRLIWSKVLIALLATVAAAGLGLLALYLMLVVARQEGGLALLVVVMATFVPWTSIFFGGGQAVEKRIIAPYKLPGRV